MNSVQLIGRPTRDIEIRYTGGENSIAIASWTLAVERRYKSEGQPSADFIRCKAFGKTAETLEKYVKQGTKIAVEGSIQTGDYTNKDGVKIYTTDVIVNNFDFCEKKNESSEPSAIRDSGFVAVPDGIDEELPFN